MESPLPLTLIPSLPAQSFAELASLAHKLEGTTKGFQIDIVDGVFVPHRSWPFTEANPSAELQKIATLPSSLTYELDCMIVNPEQYLETFLELPVELIIIHYGSTTRYEEIFARIKQRGRRAGLAFTNDVPLTDIEELLPKVDAVQVMGIAHVGRQGQPFDERTLETIATLRHKHPNLSIAVDGSVNAETIPKLREAGANHFAPGSAVSGSSDPAQAYKQLFTLLT